jgi:hypothetical protein
MSKPKPDRAPLKAVKTLKVLHECRHCEHWFGPGNWDIPVTWGKCDKINCMNDGEDPYAPDASDHLATPPTFGCSLWEEKK